MAKQGENREEIKEAKRLYRVWSQVDGKIELPASLTARALLPKLENVEQPVSPIGKIRFSPKIFTWQSGVTYAAAFALIVALSAALTQGDEPAMLLEGAIEAAPAISEEAEAYDEVLPEATTAETTAAAAFALPEAAPQPDMGAFAPRIAADEDAAVTEAAGVGGQSDAVLLGTDERYTYFWRVNDPLDPDKEGSPVTADIVTTASGELAASVDLPGMTSVEDYYLYGDIVVFAGSGESGAELYAVDLYDIENPEPWLEEIQQGTFADSSQYGTTLHLLTVTETADGLDCEVIPLPGSESAACCVVTVVDLETRETARMAFSGVDGGEIYLYNLHAYLNYDGEVTDENPTGKYLAQIRLDGMNIELTTAVEEETEASDPEQPTEETAEPEQPTEASEDPEATEPPDPLE